MDAALAEALQQVPLFRNVGDEVLECLANGTEVWLEPGTEVVSEGTTARYFWILLEGELLLTKRIDNHDMVLDTFKPGTYFGELPILIDKPIPATGRALSKLHLFKLPKEDFLGMLTTCQGITTSILRTLATRVQALQGFSKQQEKLAALGKLSAGLAHELNNPAAAGRRAADVLRETLARRDALALRLPTANAAYLVELQGAVIDRAKHMPQLDPVAQSDCEDALSTALDTLDVPDGWELAATFVGAGLDAVWLQSVADQVDPPSLPIVLRWVEATLSVQSLLDTIDQSAGRISELVHAIKTYTYMDQASHQEVDVHDGIESTLVILRHKLRHGITVVRDYDRSVPHIQAYGSELNQVWTNLLDNAIDAMEGKGQIKITTCAEAKNVLVTIEDNGPGIPPQIQARVWEPFFTTKEVGKGTGLGLDVSYGIVVGRHHGDIRVVSEPGCTRFEVRLPLNA